MIRILLFLVVVFALGLGFAYTTNRMEGAGDMRATSIIDALRASPGLATAAAPFATADQVERNSTSRAAT